MTIDLYIEDAQTCGAANVLCGVDDNRPFVQAGQPDPHADPSRNRVHMTLDFGTGELVLRVSPSCTIHPLGVGFDKMKTCTAPRPEGQGTDLNISGGPSGQVTVDVTVIQTNFFDGRWVGVNGFGKVNNIFKITPQNDICSFDLAGDGSGFPDLAVIQNKMVVYADQGRTSQNCLGLTRFRSAVLMSTIPD